MLAIRVSFPSKWPFGPVCWAIIHRPGRASDREPPFGQVCLASQSPLSPALPEEASVLLHPPGKG